MPRRRELPTRSIKVTETNSNVETTTNEKEQNRTEATNRIRESAKKYKQQDRYYRRTNSRYENSDPNMKNVRQPSKSDVRQPSRLDRLENTVIEAVNAIKETNARAAEAAKQAGSTRPQTAESTATQKSAQLNTEQLKRVEQEEYEQKIALLQQRIDTLQEEITAKDGVAENIRKGFLDKKAISVLKIINLFVENPNIAKILRFDEKVASAKEIWGDYKKDMEKSTRVKNSGTAVSEEVKRAATGEAPKTGTEAREVNFEQANKVFLKKIVSDYFYKYSKENNKTVESSKLSEILSMIETNSIISSKVDLTKLMNSEPDRKVKIENACKKWLDGNSSRDFVNLEIYYQTYL